MTTICRKLHQPVWKAGVQRTSFKRKALVDHTTVDHNEAEPVSYSRRAAISVSIASASLLLGSPEALSRETSIYDFSAEIYNSPRSLDQYRDQVLVVINVARLRKLVEKYGKDGFNLIGFPCNQFGGQAPGTSEEEREYAIRKFGFDFDVFDKIEVNGRGALPLYKYLRKEQPKSLPEGYSRPGAEQGEIEWNYTKFLINRQGKPVRRYKPGFDPLDFEGDVVNLLKGKDVLPVGCLAHPEQSICRF